MKEGGGLLKVIKAFFRKAFDLEFATDSGRYNWGSGLIVLALIVVFLAGNGFVDLLRLAISIFNPKFMPADESPWPYISILLPFFLICLILLFINENKIRRKE